MQYKILQAFAWFRLVIGLTATVIGAVIAMICLIAIMGGDVLALFSHWFTWDVQQTNLYALVTVWPWSIFGISLLLMAVGLQLCMAAEPQTKRFGYDHDLLLLARAVEYGNELLVKRYAITLEHGLTVAEQGEQLLTYRRQLKKDVVAMLDHVTNCNASVATALDPKVLVQIRGLIATLEQTLTERESETNEYAAIVSELHLALVRLDSAIAKDNDVRRTLLARKDDLVRQAQTTGNAAGATPKVVVAE